MPRLGRSQPIRGHLARPRTASAAPTPIAGTQAATGAEGTPTLLAALATVNDSGAGAESAAAAAAISSTQAATGVEGTPALLAALATVNDSGVGAESAAPA